jgi:2-dehydro-3-deoxyphosphogluconate aldolase/(4S)-4-hydroxy-2-oxoglutarate aldolase
MSGKSPVAASFRKAPVVGVVRTDSYDEAARIARWFITGGLELIEITFTVPDATRLVEELLAERGGERGAGGPPWIGMGTVTSGERADQALAAGAEFIVSPNVSQPVSDRARQNDTYLVVGALTPTEIVDARDGGADLVKVYPLPPVGGPGYLSVVRGPLGDIPMLAAGGFDIEEIPAYKKVGAVAFGIGGPLLGTTEEETARRVERALTLARPESAAGERG